MFYLNSLCLSHWRSGLFRSFWLINPCPSFIVRILFTPTPVILSTAPARPANLYQIYLRPLLEPEVQPQIVLRDVSSTAVDFFNLLEIARRR